MNVHESLGRQGLYRPRADRVLGGVIAGLGRRFGIDPWPARVLFLLGLMVLPGSQVVVYPVLWVLMPSERYAPERSASTQQHAPSGRYAPRPR